MDVVSVDLEPIVGKETDRLQEQRHYWRPRIDLCNRWRAIRRNCQYRVEARRWGNRGHKREQAWIRRVSAICLKDRRANMLTFFWRLITEWRIQKRVEEQFQAFITGFHELIPADLVNVFDERELELLIGGIADIDVEDWKKHTDYRGYTENDEVIQNFWKCIRSWDAEQKSRLLQFATGTSRIPVNGFKDLQGSDGPRRFTIEKAGEPNQLPKSHTWYVQIQSKLTCILLTNVAVSTVLTYHRTRRSKHSIRSSPLLSKKRLGLDRNKRPPSGRKRGKSTHMGPHSQCTKDERHEAYME